MKKSLYVFLGLLLCLTLASTASAKKQRKRPPVWGVPTIYSDLYVEGETGDVGGLEVIVIPADHGLWAAVVIGSGIAFDPVLVPVYGIYPNIEFTIPSVEHYENYGKVTGKISSNGLTLWNKNFGRLYLRKQGR